MNDCSATNNYEILKQMGIDVWLSADPNSVKTSDQPAVLTEAAIAVTTPQIWLDSNPDSPASWNLPDSILSALRLNRTDLEVACGGEQPKLESMRAPSLIFADGVENSLPSLTTLLANPKLKAKVWQHLQTLC